MNLSLLFSMGNSNGGGGGVGLCDMRFLRESLLFVFKMLFKNG